MPIYGNPSGATRALVRNFGDRAHAGARGEEMTNQMLERAYREHHTVWVFHDLKMPGWGKANVDHVIVQGTRVVVVDTKTWLPGLYFSFAGGVYRKTRKGFERFKPAEDIVLTRQCGELRSYLESTAKMRVDVRGMVAIWPSHPGALSFRRPLFSLRLPGRAKFCHGRTLTERVDVELRGSTPVVESELLTALERLTPKKRVRS